VGDSIVLLGVKMDHLGPFDEHWIIDTIRTLESQGVKFYVESGEVFYSVQGCNSGDPPFWVLQEIRRLQGHKPFSDDIIQRYYTRKINAIGEEIEQERQLFAFKS
jgi:hypothetical protein